MNEANKDVIEAVSGKLAGAEDNLYRTKMGFRHLNMQGMAGEWGQSGRTCNEILDGAIEEVARWKKALESLK